MKKQLKRGAENSLIESTTFGNLIDVRVSRKRKTKVTVRL